MTEFIPIKEAAKQLDMREMTLLTKLYRGAIPQEYVQDRGHTRPRWLVSEEYVARAKADRQLMTLKQFMEATGRTQSFIWNLVTSGELKPVIDIEGKNRFTQDHIEQLSKYRKNQMKKIHGQGIAQFRRKTGLTASSIIYLLAQNKLKPVAANREIHFSEMDEEVARKWFSENVGN